MTKDSSGNSSKLLSASITRNSPGATGKEHVYMDSVFHDSINGFHLKIFQILWTTFFFMYVFIFFFFLFLPQKNVTVSTT